MPRALSTHVRIVGVAAIMLSGASALAEDEHEIVPLPVVRGDVGFLSTSGSDETAVVGQLEVGVHLHYRYGFFGGELGYAASQASEPAPAQFFELALPIGVTTTEAFFGIGFTPRLFLGERQNADITALRLAGTIYCLGGTIVLELGHERWFGDGGSVHVVGFLGVDAGRFIYLITDGSDLSKIR